MQLHLMTWPEVESYLLHSKGILIPIGSTEQHGPTGLIGTDCICPEVIANKVAEQINALVGPTINIGIAQHHLDFPGTISLKPSTLIQVIKDYVSSLSRHGFERFYFLNGHGGNISTVQAAFSEIYSATSLLKDQHAGAVKCKLVSWYLLPEVSKLANELYGDKEGKHATPSEVSVTQYAYPEHIKSAQMGEPESYKSFYDAADFRRSYPDGRIASYPSLASPEDGAHLVDVCVSAVNQDYLVFVSSEA